MGAKAKKSLPDAILNRANSSLENLDKWEMEIYDFHLEKTKILKFYFMHFAFQKYDYRKAYKTKK